MLSVTPSGRKGYLTGVEPVPSASQADMQNRYTTDTKVAGATTHQNHVGRSTRVDPRPITLIRLK